MKEQERKQNRVIKALVVAYMLLGYGLLYSVYQLELLTVRLLSHCRLVIPFDFAATDWNERTLWVPLAFPLTWPILTLRALLLLFVAAVAAGTEGFHTHLFPALERLGHQLVKVTASFWQALIRLAVVLRQALITAASFIWRRIHRLLLVVHSGMMTLAIQIVALALRLYRAIAPLIAIVKKVILSVYRRFWSTAIIVCQAVRTWLVEAFRLVRRGIITAGLWLWIWIQTLGRGLHSGIRIGQRWLILAATEAWRYLQTAWRYLRVAWLWLMIHLRVIGSWLLIPGRWLWAGMIALHRELRVIAGLVWVQLRAGIRAAGRRLLVPLRWLAFRLAAIWRQITVALFTFRRWLVSTVVTIWRWIRAPFIHLWSGLLAAWNRLLALGAAIWHAARTFVKWSSSLIAQLCTMLDVFLQSFWQSVARIMAPVRRWVLARWRQIWDGINRAWVNVKETAQLLWRWIINGCLLLWRQVVILARSIWKPIHAIWTVVSQQIRALWHQMAGLVRSTRQWVTLRVTAFQLWTRQMWDLAKKEIRATLRRFLILTAFWKRLIAHLHESREQMIRYLGEVKASLGNRLRDNQAQLAEMMSGLRLSIQNTVVEARQWLAEVRDQTAEALRNVVPHG